MQRKFYRRIFTKSIGIKDVYLKLSKIKEEQHQGESNETGNKSSNDTRIQNGKDK